MKTYNIKTRKSKQAKMEINRIIKTHEEYKNSYFRHPSRSADGRRRNERKFKSKNPEVCFILPEDEKLIVKMMYSESCNNVYYSLSVTQEHKGIVKSKDIRAVKNLLK